MIEKLWKCIELIRMNVRGVRIMATHRTRGNPRMGWKEEQELVKKTFREEEKVQESPESMSPKEE